MPYFVDSDQKSGKITVGFILRYQLFSVTLPKQRKRQHNIGIEDNN